MEKEDAPTTKKAKKKDKETNRAKELFERFKKEEVHNKNKLPPI